MRKLFSVFMMSAVLALVGGCKSSQKREIANAGADPYVIQDFNYKLSDIKTLGVTKEQLFAELDPQKIILNSASVCSNRALLWSWNMKRKHNIDSGKIFVFYSRGFFNDPEFQKASGHSIEPGEEVERQWWYHVAPYVIEDGKEYVLDGGFQYGRIQTPAEEITTPWKGRITRALTVNEWLLHFPKTTDCVELTAADTVYTDHMRRGQAMLHPRDGGKARCYIRRAPMQYWTPLSIAMHELGKTAKGETLIQPFNREIFFESDILSACEEAVSADGIAKYFGKGQKMKGCLQYLGLVRSSHYSRLQPLQPNIFKADKKLQRRKDRALRMIERDMR